MKPKQCLPPALLFSEGKQLILCMPLLACLNRAFIGIMLKGEKHDPKLLDALEAAGMRPMALPQTRYRKAVFPFKNFLSVILAVIKVYPAANKCQHLAEGQEDLACGKMEIYEPNEIVFVFPVENAAAFQHPDGPYDAKKKK